MNTGGGASSEKHFSFDVQQAVDHRTGLVDVDGDHIAAPRIQQSRAEQQERGRALASADTRRAVVELIICFPLLLFRFNDSS